MSKINTALIAKVGVLSALGVLAITVLRIPGPGGKVFFHLGETVIISAAVLLGKKGGAFVGAVSSAIADMLLGAPLWAPFSFLIHGVEGYVIGDLSDGSCGKQDVIAMLCGIVIMIAGYTVVAGFLYGAAIMPVEFVGDSLQGSFGIATAYPFLRFVRYRFPDINGYR